MTACNRVVITGMGIVSPVGSRVDEAWRNIVDGVSGIGEITAFDASDYPTRIAGSVRGFDAGEYLGPKELRKTDTFIHYGVGAARQAWQDAGIQADDENRERIGVCIGSGIGGIGSIEQQSRTLDDKGIKRVSPFYIPSAIVNMVSGHVSIELGLAGPNLALATACSTGTHAIGVAASLIRSGAVDVMLAGGAEHGSTPSSMAGFCQARALSTRNDDPQAASRPWDRKRDGFVLSDGAGVLVLESLEHAQARGARIYAELAGAGFSGDASHVTLPPSDGDGARRCMQAALRDAGVDLEQVGYVNAHGTSTPAGDIAETVAIHRTFGEHAKRLAVSSTKSMTGHLLGAAGAVEAIFTTLALHHQLLPPTINLDEPGEGCDLDYVPHTARDASLDVALSNSFGFGGTNGTLVFRRLADSEGGRG